MYDIAIVGGGLAGLFSSILLSRAGLKVVLFEKKQYPFHRVCGEYISNEVLPFLEKHDLFPAEFQPSRLDRLMITSSSGSGFSIPLDLGGFGISRYTYDHWLANKSRDSGTQMFENTTVRDIERKDDLFLITTSSGECNTSKLVIGAQGKRTKLDQHLNRPFIDNHSPYLGVKYHLKTDLPEDTIALHNFSGGYCGVSMVENKTYNLCYLIHRDRVRRYGSIEATEHQLLRRNPHIKRILNSSEFIFDKPEVINEVSFKSKESAFKGILMAGDAAGTITPLSGNGMSMAIRSAHLLSREILANYCNERFDQNEIIERYSAAWAAQFNKQMWIGRQIQRLYFGHPLASHIAVLTGKLSRSLAGAIVKQTHGEPFS